MLAPAYPAGRGSFNAASWPAICLRQTVRLDRKFPGPPAAIGEFSLAGLLGRCYERDNTPPVRFPFGDPKHHNKKVSQTCR